jgi:hypothetical protein
LGSIVKPPAAVTPSFSSQPEDQKPWANDVPLLSGESAGTFHIMDPHGKINRNLKESSTHFLKKGATSKPHFYIFLGE